MKPLADPRELAQGRWRWVLTELGVDRKYLTGRNGPCPLCGGTDRYRFTDHEGRGLWVCNQCGGGDGINLLEQVHGWNYATCAQRIRELCAMEDAPSRKPVNQDNDDKRRKDQLNALWLSSAPLGVIERDLALMYLASREIHLQKPYPKDLRFCRECQVSGVSGTKTLPAMIALVRDENGKPVNIHRTYLKWRGKAEIDSPRRMMPGSLPSGSAIRLQDIHNKEEMGVAEGIESAFGASFAYKIPVWSCINANLMASWKPPQGINKVYIFMDNDRSHIGHARGYELANKIAQKYREVHPVPVTLNEPGLDMADVWKRMVAEM